MANLPAELVSILRRYQVGDSTVLAETSLSVIAGQAADEIEDMRQRLTRINDNWPHVSEVNQLRLDLAQQTANATAVLQAEHERDCAVEKLAELGKWAEYWANHKSDNPQDRGWSFAAQEVMQKLRAPTAATVDVGDKHGG